MAVSSVHAHDFYDLMKIVVMVNVNEMINFFLLFCIQLFICNTTKKMVLTQMLDARAFDESVQCRYYIRHISHISHKG